MTTRLLLVTIGSLAACGGVESDPQAPDAPLAPDATESVDASTATCATPPVELRARWNGEQNAADETGAFPGVAAGGPAFTTGRHGSAFLFDGIDDLVTADTADLLWPSGSFTAEAWIKSTAITGDFVTVATKYECGGTACGGAYWGLHVYPDHHPSFEMRVDGSGVFAIRATTVDVIDGEWHHLVGVRDIASKQLILYVDGVLAASRGIDGPELGPLTNLDQSPDPVTIGASQNSGVETFIGHFSGAIDDVAVYFSAASAADVAALHAAPDGPCR